MNQPKKIEIDIAWQAIPGTSQEFAVDTRCHHTLYHGTRGPGKTSTQLARFRRHVGLGYGSFWKGVIFDTEFKNLSDLVAQSKRLFPAFNDGARFQESASGYKWTWPNTGEELLFRHVKKNTDYEKFHGHEYPFIGWNELTKWPTSELYDLMMSTNRSSFTPEKHTPKKQDGTYDTPDGKPLPKIPLEIFSTTNPSGPGHNWVKRRFINCAKNGQVVKTKSEVFNPQQKKNVEITKTQVAIFGSYRENIFLDPVYIASLNELTRNNTNLRKAWLEGSWDFTAGGAIDDLWDRNVHVVPRFKVPKEWFLNRSFDWGSSHPFSVGWWAEANGEEIEFDDGRKWAPQRGSLIQISEWYGTVEIGTNKGLKTSAGDIAEGVKSREKSLMESAWVAEQPYGGPADNQIDDVRESDVDSIAKKMSDKGIRWIKSDKSPGSRRVGLQLLRDRLESSTRGEGPGIYFMQNCAASIETLPSLPRGEKDPDDVDTLSEDHVYDMARYRVLQSNNRFAKKVKIKFAT